MVQMLRLGVIPFGVILLAPTSPDDPEVLASDLAGMNPTAADIRAAADAFTPRLSRLYRERHGIEVLATFAYPAQVVFCAKPLGGLADLKGRTVRVSSVTQFDFIEALGGKPVSIPFAEAVDSLRKNVVECVITGSLSGNQVGLHKLTTHIHDMAFNWGLSVFAANAQAWNALDPAVRRFLLPELQRLQAQAWEAAAANTRQGFACNTGAAGCVDGEPGHMVLVRASPEDEGLRRRVFDEIVVKRWLERCGDDCVRLWRESLEPALDARTK
jgi:TRAP-type C4-dicarboxylate transport system substrate-binding protein